MKKLVNTVVVGTALAATMITGCSSNEPTTPTEETTPKETTVETTTPVETTAPVEETTAPAEETTVPEEETTTSTMEDPTMEVTVFEEPDEPTQAPTTNPCPMDGYVCGNDYCPNATDWA